MARRSFGAVAVDMGASSVRIAAGWLEGGEIRYEIVKQVPHEPIKGHWSYDLLSGLCHDAVDYAVANFKRATVGIDTWGVDHGFIDAQGKTIRDPVAYRDDSHTRVYDEMVGHRMRLYELTGVQHQPFNTLYQLIARRREHPDWPGKMRWLLLPDLFGHELTKRVNHESTQCSTTQMMGLDGRWCEEVFDLAEWPVPLQQPMPCGRLLGQIVPGVELASVASHDTASAVCGLGTLRDSDVFLNIGTWTLLGTVIDKPLVSSVAENGGWTNERTHDGRVRFLKNIPGFYIINRLHDEMGVPESIPEWLAHADYGFDGKFDYFHKDLYNPHSMSASVLELASRTPTKAAHWAAMAIRSLVNATVHQPAKLGEVVGRQFTRIRVAGGGCQNPDICQGLADGTGLEVVSGPVEATVLGNLGVQMVAAGEIRADELGSLIDASGEMRRYEPGVPV
ncbi:MAG TPA: FGGY-family carbohydrate kinase [Fimbriimonadaceae bacterium]|nr:FGGY-family carbohydrate kinase [Fimbriimonadaceae bacterium]